MIINSLKICYRNNAVSPEDKVLLTLRFYATGSMLIVCGDFIGIHKSTASRIVKLVSHTIALLREQFVNFPNNENDIKKLKQDFFNIAKFPMVVGALDCTHVKIKSPGGDNAEAYRNSGYAQRNYVMTLVGNPGKVIDPVSGINEEAVARYNESLIRTRNTIERCFGVWKRRFPILATGINVKIASSQSIIVATAVLHNIACNFGENMPRVTTQIESSISMTDFNNPGGNIDRNAINNITRKKLLRYFSNLN